MSADQSMASYSCSNGTRTTSLVALLYRTTGSTKSFSLSRYSTCRILRSFVVVLRMLIKILKKLQCCEMFWIRTCLTHFALGDQQCLCYTGHTKCSPQCEASRYHSRRNPRILQRFLSEFRCNGEKIYIPMLIATPFSLRCCPLMHNFIVVRWRVSHSATLTSFGKCTTASPGNHSGVTQWVGIALLIGLFIPLHRICFFNFIWYATTGRHGLPYLPQMSCRMMYARLIKSLGSPLF